MGLVACHSVTVLCLINVVILHWVYSLR